MFGEKRGRGGGGPAEATEDGPEATPLLARPTMPKKRASFAVFAGSKNKDPAKRPPTMAEKQMESMRVIQRQYDSQRIERGLVEKKQGAAVGDMLEDPKTWDAIDFGEEENVECSTFTTTCPEQDSYLSAFVAVACAAGMAIYSSPMFDTEVEEQFSYAKWWGGWFLLTNVSNISQLLFFVPGIFLDMYGAVPVFRICASLTLVVYIIGGGWEYLATPGEMPYGVALFLTAVVGICSAGLQVCALRLVGDTLATDSPFKARTYGAICVAKATGCITYASVSTVDEHLGLSGAFSTAFGDSAVPWVGRIPFALATFLLSFGFVIPPRADRIDSMMSSSFAGSTDTYRAPWWPTVTLTVITFLNPESLFKFLYNTWIFNSSSFSEAANYGIPEGVLFFEYAMLAIVLVLALRRWCTGSNRAKINPLRSVDFSFVHAWNNYRLWALTITVGIVCGAGSVVLNDAREITSDWYGGDTGYLFSMYAPAISVGVLIGCLFTTVVFEKLVGCNARRRAGGILSWANCWIVGAGLIILLTMGHDCPYNGVCSKKEWGSDRRLAVPGGRGATSTLVMKYTQRGGVWDGAEAAVEWDGTVAAEAGVRAEVEAEGRRRLGGDTASPVWVPEGELYVPKYEESAAVEEPAEPEGLETLEELEVAEVEFHFEDDTDLDGHHHHHSTDDGASPTPSPTPVGYEGTVMTESEWVFLCALMLVGVGFGGICTLVPVLLDDWFGVSSFGALLGVVMLGAVFGHLLFVNGIAYHYVNECSNAMSEQCFKPTFKWCALAVLFIAPLQVYVDAKEDAAAAALLK